MFPNNEGMLKYFSELGGRDSVHGERLHWPGTPLGFPFRGAQAPLLKQHEAEALPHVFNFHSRLFRLWEPEDKRLFDEVYDKINNGWFYERRRIDKEEEGHLEPVVWLEWIQIYGQSPPVGARSVLA